MDIQIASNFERYLYYLRDEDSGQVKADMEEFAETGRLDLADLRAAGGPRFCFPQCQ